jgi:hypothetical protein
MKYWYSEQFKMTTLLVKSLMYKKKQYICRYCFFLVSYITNSINTSAYLFKEEFHKHLFAQKDMHLNFRIIIAITVQNFRFVSKVANILEKFSCDPEDRNLLLLYG